MIPRTAAFMQWLAAFTSKPAAPDSLPRADATNAQVLSIFNVVLGLAGALAVAFIVWGAIKYILSGGDANNTRQARETILYALIGLVVVILSFSIVNYIVGRF